MNSNSTLNEQFNEEKVEIVAHNFWISLLYNKDFSEKFNPELLLDNYNTFDKKGEGTILEELGFVQIFSLDCFEFSKTLTCPKPEELKKEPVNEPQLNQGWSEDVFTTTYGYATMVNMQ